MRKFMNHEKQNGELAIRRLSEKAQKAYYGTDDLAVYECEQLKEGVDLDTAEYNFKSDICEKRYYIRGMIDVDNLTFEELEAQFENYFDALEDC